MYPSVNSLQKQYIFNTILQEACTQKYFYLLFEIYLSIYHKLETQVHIY